MNTQREKKLLRITSGVPVLLVIILFSVFMINSIRSHNERVQNDAHTMEKQYINLKKNEVKKEVLKILDIIQGQYDTKKVVPNLSNKTIKQQIKSIIQSVHYDKNGYIFIVDLNGNLLINIKQSLLNENQIYLHDKNGVHIIESIITKAQNGGGFVEYIGIPGTHSPQSKKISYVDYFVPFGWSIGYGFHPSDIQCIIDENRIKREDQHRKELFDFIGIALGLTVILIIILVLLSKKIENIFENYKIKIKNAQTQQRKQNEIIYQQSKMTLIAELLNMISHQWRQPLSQINSLTLSLYLEQKNGTLKTESLHEKINSIENTTHYLSQTIDDFSHFFIQESQANDFTVNDSIKSCISIVNPSLNHIDLQFDLQSTQKINGYKTLFQQTILSLISNAIDIFHESSVYNPKLKIRSYDRKEHIYTEIIDNGGGISQENFDKIFDLYFSTKNKKVPSGLGLYIVKEIVIKHFNGEIFATNINNGAKFTIRIPQIAKK